MLTCLRGMTRSLVEDVFDELVADRSRKLSQEELMALTGFVGRFGLTSDEKVEAAPASTSSYYQSGSGGGYYANATSQYSSYSGHYQHGGYYGGQGQYHQYHQQHHHHATQQPEPPAPPKKKPIPRPRKWCEFLIQSIDVPEWYEMELLRDAGPLGNWIIKVRELSSPS